MPSFPIGDNIKRDRLYKISFKIRKSWPFPVHFSKLEKIGKKFIVFIAWLRLENRWNIYLWLLMILVIVVKFIILHRLGNFIIWKVVVVLVFIINIILVETLQFLFAAATSLWSVWIIWLMVHWLVLRNCSVTVWNEFAKMAHVSEMYINKTPWLPYHKNSRWLIMQQRLFDLPRFDLLITFLLVIRSNFGRNHQPIIFDIVRKFDIWFLKNPLSIHRVWINLIDE